MQPARPAPRTAPKPATKWVGGKRQLLAEIRKRLPPLPDGEGGHYYEPFVGGGAVFFDLAASEQTGNGAHLNDSNAELVDAYRALRDDLDGVTELLSEHVNDRDYYYALRARSLVDMTLCERAARFLYLNRVGFNGLYRVNKSGGFNVPFGKYENPTICDLENLRAVSIALDNQTVEISCQDFAAAVKLAGVGDVVYFDPPYWPVSKTANFTAYSAGGFGPRDQERLCDVARELVARGAYVLLSNADVPEVRKLYEGFKIERIEARRNINSDGTKRGAVGELLISGG